MRGDLAACLTADRARQLLLVQVAFSQGRCKFKTGQANPVLQNFFRSPRLMIAVIELARSARLTRCSPVRALTGPSMNHEYVPKVLALALARKVDVATRKAAPFFELCLKIYFIFSWVSFWLKL